MRHPTREAFVASTDKAWFDFLRELSERGRVDEVNFWLPKATRPMKRAGARVMAEIGRIW